MHNLKIGIGLPNSIPGTPGELLPKWAALAEEAGFATLATIDRVAYPSFASLVSLAASASVTKRIGLLTNVLLAPTHNAAVLAKEAASVNEISGGRLKLGLGIGRREDDYASAGLDFSKRGRAFDAQLETITKAWRGEPLVEGSKPVVPGEPGAHPVPILIGGSPPRATERIVKYGAGWTIAGVPPETVADLVSEVRQAWRDAGREGEAQVVALGYFAIGDEASVDYLLDYYAFLGPGAQAIASSAARSANGARTTLAKWEAAGIDEYIFNPAFPDVAQVSRLADAVL